MVCIGLHWEGVHSTSQWPRYPATGLDLSLEWTQAARPADLCTRSVVTVWNSREEHVNGAPFHVSSAGLTTRCADPFGAKELRLQNLVAANCYLPVERYFMQSAPHATNVWLSSQSWNWLDNLLLESILLLCTARCRDPPITSTVTSQWRHSGRDVWFGVAIVKGRHGAAIAKRCHCQGVNGNSGKSDAK